MLLKLSGSLFVIISCGLLGLKFSNDYVGRIIKLNNFKKMIKILKNEITYNNESILEAIRKSVTTADKMIDEFLFGVIDIYKNGVSLKEAWENSVEINLKKSVMKDTDLELIKQLGNNLGVTCRETQIDYIDNFIGKIDMLEAELQEQKEEKCKLYKSMGVMTGLFIVVLFI